MAQPASTSVWTGAPRPLGEEPSTSPTATGLFSSPHSSMHPYACLRHWNIRPTVGHCFTSPPRFQYVHLQSKHLGHRCFSPGQRSGQPAARDRRHGSPAAQGSPCVTQPLSPELPPGVPRLQSHTSARKCRDSCARTQGTGWRLALPLGRRFGRADPEIPSTFGEEPCLAFPRALPGPISPSGSCPCPRHGGGEPALREASQDLTGTHAHVVASGHSRRPGPGPGLPVAQFRRRKSV